MCTFEYLGVSSGHRLSAFDGFILYLPTWELPLRLCECMPSDFALNDSTWTCLLSRGVGSLLRGLKAMHTHIHKLMQTLLEVVISNPFCAFISPKTSFFKMSYQWEVNLLCTSLSNGSSLLINACCPALVFAGQRHSEEDWSWDPNAWWSLQAAGCLLPKRPGFGSGKESTDMQHPYHGLHVRTAEDEGGSGHAESHTQIIRCRADGRQAPM